MEDQERVSAASILTAMSLPISAFWGPSPKATPSGRRGMCQKLRLQNARVAFEAKVFQPFLGLDLGLGEWTEVKWSGWRIFENSFAPKTAEILAQGIFKSAIMRGDNIFDYSGFLLIKK